MMWLKLKAWFLGRPLIGLYFVDTMGVSIDYYAIPYQDKFSVWKFSPIDLEGDYNVHGSEVFEWTHKKSLGTGYKWWSMNDDARAVEDYLPYPIPR